MSTTNVATMTASELQEFIAETEAQHREYMKSLRALMRVRFIEEGKREAAE